MEYCIGCTGIREITWNNSFLCGSIGQHVQRGCVIILTVALIISRKKKLYLLKNLSPFLFILVSVGKSIRHITFCWFFNSNLRFWFYNLEQNTFIKMFACLYSKFRRAYAPHIFLNAQALTSISVDNFSPLFCSYEMYKATKRFNQRVLIRNEHVLWSRVCANNPSTFIAILMTITIIVTTTDTMIITIITITIKIIVE